MKVVLKLDLDGDKQKQKAFEAVSTLHGIDSIAVDLKVRRMTVVGAVDPADVLKKLRNSFPATDIVSVEPAKEEKRKDAVEIQTLHGYPHHPPLPGGSGEHPHLVTAELPSPRKTVELPERSTEAPVCALVDAMYRLPAKLDGLLRHGHMLPKGSEHEIPLIKQDLEVMIAVLHDYSNSGAENCAMMIECLMKEVRELSYDIEDCIDQYEQAVDSMSGSVFRIPRRQITRRKSKTSRLPKKLKQRLSMANKIREFSMRSQEALQRYSLFNPDGICTSSTRCDVSFGSWHPTPYVEHADHLVGIDDPTNRLEAWLTRDGEQKKFVSILGSGGVGKTTLANELYRRIGWQFECRAFVRTCQKPDIRKLLISMLSQVRPNQPPGDWKVHGLIADIRTHLQDKRYLIVVDDVWATSTWDIVNCALPDGNRCSRILITTEIDDVAQKCCGYDLKYVFKMKPLGEDDSRKLFLSTVVGPPESSEVSNSIIRKCGGLPLATVTIASLLASRIGKPEQWDYINKSLGYGLRMNPTFEGMKQVLNLSYNNLPQHLKPCMLYLSIYQEDYIIWKDDLVKQWIAEGFICATEGKDEEEISRSYFDELMSSRMIQPVHINDTDEILSCTVHYMVLNFIKHKSIVENFVTAIDYSQTSTRLADKVRRLSLQFGNAEDATPPTNMRLSQVRTLAFFGVFKRVPSIVEFRLLQVLILHLWGDEESISFDLSRISELFRLRYLQVTCNVTLELQIQMQGLQYLETLKIDARVSTVPSNIVHLPGLLYLSLPVETNLPNGIGRMASLRTLGYFDLSSNSIDNVQSIGELTNLQDLQLTCSTVPSDYLESKMNSMGLILAKLGNLKSLTLEPSSILDAGPSSMSISCDVWSSISSPPALLQRLEWLPHICTFSSLPKWIGHLGKLCILKFGIRELARNDVDLLRGLPALTVLSLYVRTKPAERIVFGKGGFLVLKHFEFRCCVPCLQFEAYSMPNLRKLKLGFDAHGADQQGSIPVGFEHLSGLKEICAKIGGARANEPGRRSAESALGDAIRMHPGRPTVNIQCVDRMFGGKDYQNTRIQEEEHMTLQKQYELIEEDSNEQHVGLQKGSREDADSRISTLLDLQIPLNKKLDEHNDDKLEHAIEVVVNKHADIGLNRESHGSSSSRPGLNRGSHGSSSRPGRLRRNLLPNLSVLASVLEDGYRWRKYGQKVIQNAKHPKSYYRCEHKFTRGCMAHKQVQLTDRDPKLFNITYLGNHTCVPSTHSLPQSGQEQSSVSLGIKAEGSVQGLQTPLLSPFGAAGSRSLGCFSASPMSVETSESQITDEAVSGSRAGASSMSAATSESQVTHEAVSGSRAGASSMSAATSESQVTHEAVSGSRAGASSMSAATSESQVTHEAVSGSRAGASSMSAATSESQVTHEAVSGSRARASSMSAATSESQVTHEAVSGSRAGASAMSAATSESQVTHEAVSGRSFVHVRGDIGEPGYQ